MNLAFVIFVSFLVANVSGDNFISSNAYMDGGRICAQMGENFTIYCTMNLPDFLGYNSSNLNFFFDSNETLNDVFASFKKEILNETTLAVHVYDPPELDSVIECMVALNGSNRNDELGVHMIQILIGLPPAKVNNFKCRTYNWERMVCTFSVRDNPVYPWYDLFYGNRKEHITTLLENRDVKDNTNYIYTLSYETGTYSPGHKFYYFELMAGNVLGELNQTFVVNNHRSCITDPPEKLTISRIGKYETQLNWQVPPIMKVFGTDITHKIMYSFNNSSFIEYKNFSSHENDNNMIVLNVPLANTLYEVRVYIKVTAAPNTDEFWSYSKTTFSTLPDRPSKPPTVTAGSFYREVDSNDLNVYWKEVENIYKNGQGYNVSIVDRDGNNVKIIHMTNTMATIPCVDDMTYKLYSENVIGKLETYSEIFVPSTQLPKITDIKSILMDNTYRLSWSYTVPNNFNEDIENFTVFWCTVNSAAIDECVTWIDFKILDNSTMNFTHTSYFWNYMRYNFAVAVNTKTTSSGMAWAQCTADPNTSLGKFNSFYISSVGSNYIVVQWAFDCIYKTVVTGINLKYCKLRDPKDASCAMIHSIPGNETGYGIVNLVPYTSYSISMQIYSNTRIGIFSDSQVYTTLESEPSVPRNLRYSNLTYNSTYIEWDEPLNKNGRLDRYELWYKAKNDPVEQKQIRIEESSSLSYVLSNLNSYTTYEIWVIACTSYCSNSSNLITITTKIGPPMKVLDFIAERGRNNSQIISWKQAKPTGPHEIYDVIVLVTVRDTKFEYIASTVKGTQCTIKMESICNQDDISYDFYVKPKNIIYKDGNEYLDHKSKIEKRQIFIDTNSENRFSFKRLWNQLFNINDDIINDENRIYCLEALQDMSNFHVVYVGEAVVLRKLIVCYGSELNIGHPTFFIIPLGLTVLFAMGFMIYKKRHSMNDFKIDLREGFKELKMEKPIPNFIDLNYANISPYILAKEKEERLHVYIDEQEQCLLKQRLESISSTSNNSGDNHYVCNEAIDNAHSIDHPPMDNKFETVTENDDSDKSTVSTYKIPMEVFPPVTLPTTTRIIPSISQEHLLESPINTHSNIDLRVMEEEKQKNTKMEEKNEKVENVAVQSAVENNHDVAVQPSVNHNIDAPSCTQTSTPYTPIDKLSPICLKKVIEPNLENKNR